LNFEKTENRSIPDRGGPPKTLERHAMIRRASLVLVGALMGATAMSVIYAAGVPAEAAGASTYKELSVFGDVFERVRAQYVTPPAEDKLIENAIRIRAI
jgi:C-terminal processing protease CtpA/Prc